MEVKIKMKMGGHRNSPTRDILIEILQKAHSPLSVPEIQKTLNKQDKLLNKTTVYREIQKLIVHGIIREIYLGTDKTRYEIVDGEHHHHIMCTSCKKVDKIPLDDGIDKKERQIAKSLNYTNINHSLEFFGLCKNCN